jgi:hypothetical protein
VRADLPEVPKDFWMMYDIICPCLEKYLDVILALPVPQFLIQRFASLSKIHVIVGEPEKHASVGFMHVLYLIRDPFR